jgi:hypothetical protein
MDFGHPAFKDKILYNLFLVRSIALRILEKPNSTLGTLSSIIAGEIDADRIDYTLRDSLASGLDQGRISIERLLNSFQMVVITDISPELLKAPDQNPTGDSSQKARHLGTHGVKQAAFAILPSVRALGVLEDLFNLRFELYRRVIFHHRTIKRDALLEQSVLDLAKQWLLGEEHADEASFELPLNISGLWKVLEKREYPPKERNSGFIQWDDAWMLTALRHIYMNKIQESTEGDLVFYRLEETLTNKKHYFSLFKRQDGFSVVDKAFSETLANSLDSDCWSEFHKMMPENWKKDALRFQAIIVERQKLADDTPFFRLGLLERLHQNSNGYFHALVREAADELARKSGFSEAIVIIVAFPSQIFGNQLLVTSSGDTVQLDVVSTLAVELSKKTQHFPPFFIFLKGEIETGREVKLQRDLGELIAKKMAFKLKNLRTQAAFPNL